MGSLNYMDGFDEFYPPSADPLGLNWMRHFDGQKLPFGSTHERPAIGPVSPDAEVGWRQVLYYCHNYDLALKADEDLTMIP